MIAFRNNNKYSTTKMKFGFQPTKTEVVAFSNINQQSKLIEYKAFSLQIVNIDFRNINK